MSNSMDLNDGLKVADLVVRYVKALLLFKIVFKIIIFNLILKNANIWHITSTLNLKWENKKKHVSLKSK